MANVEFRCTIVENIMSVTHPFDAILATQRLLQLHHQQTVWRMIAPFERRQIRILRRATGIAVRVALGGRCPEADQQSNRQRSNSDRRPMGREHFAYAFEIAGLQRWSTLLLLHI